MLVMMPNVSTMVNEASPSPTVLPLIMIEPVEHSSVTSVLIFAEAGQLISGGQL